MRGAGCDVRKGAERGNDSDELTAGVCHGVRNTPAPAPDANEERTRQQVVARERVSGADEELGGLQAVLQHDPAHRLLDLRRHVFVERLQPIVRRP